jgi:hypothetical protein
MPASRFSRIEELNLSVRSRNCLSQAGIKRIGHLTLRTEQDLRKIGNLGRASLNEIKSVLCSFGLTLRPEPRKATREVYAARNAIIRASHDPPRVLAERLGVSRSRIGYIRSRERYDRLALLKRRAFGLGMSTVYKAPES